MRKAKNKVIYLDSFEESYSDLKERSKIQGAKTKELKFFINKSFQSKGKIVASLSDFPKRVNLIRVFSKKTKKKDSDEKYEYLVAFIDDLADTRYWREIETLSDEFYQYSFVSNKQEYTLFSAKELTEGTCHLKGVLIYLSDKLEVSKHANVSSKKPLILVHNVTSDIRRLSCEEVGSWMGDHNLTNYEDFMNAFFSLEDGYSYRFDFFLEVFLISNLLGSKYQTYSNNLLIFGRPGEGKTYLIGCCAKNFEEEIIDCSSSSLKGIIPSFKNCPPDPGHLLRSKRLAIGDEFLRVLNRMRSEDRHQQLASMNNLLEHKKQSMGAGTGRISAIMTSQAIFVSNPPEEGMGARHLVEKIENSFLSRFLILFLEKDHTEFVNQKKKNPEKSKQLLEPSTWISLYDTAKANKVKLDDSKLRKIDELSLSFFQPEQEKLKEVYEARAWHHLNCLADGFVKLRCILEGDSSFTPKEADYRCVRALWSKTTLSWGLNPPYGNNLGQDMEFLRNTLLRLQQDSSEHYAKSVNKSSLEVR
jgi:hypothetical protein